MQIRTFRSTDVETIVALFKDTVRTVNRRDYTAEQVLAWAPDCVDVEAWRRRMEQAYTLIAEFDGQIIGFAELRGDGRLHTFYVHVEWQNRGVGKLLLRHIEEQAVSLKFCKVDTEASITAKPFFMRYGFHVLREQSVERAGIQLTNYFMEKDLIGS